MNIIKVLYYHIVQNFGGETLQKCSDLSNFLKQVFVSKANSISQNFTIVIT